MTTFAVTLAPIIVEAPTPKAAAQAAWREMQKASRALWPTLVVTPLDGTAAVEVGVQG